MKKKGQESEQGLQIQELGHLKKKEMILARNFALSLIPVSPRVLTLFFFHI